jgi:hypothetical protein
MLRAGNRQSGCSYERATDLTRHYASAGPPEQWAGSIPTVGYLTFDYVSHKEPCVNAVCVTMELLKSLLMECGVTFQDDEPVLPEGMR